MNNVAVCLFPSPRLYGARGTDDARLRSEDAAKRNLKRTSPENFGPIQRGQPIKGVRSRNAVTSHPGDDLKTLFVTSGGTLWSIRVTTPGRPDFPN